MIMLTESIVIFVADNSFIDIVGFTTLFGSFILRSPSDAASLSNARAVLADTFGPLTVMPFR